LSTVIKVLFYNDDRVLTTEFLVNPLEGVYGVHIPVSQWDTLEVLESGTVIFEVKNGPYSPLGE
jgi:cupin fold WbuC family metalloprotein